jgi:secondary thiamine-phosphate synthase enzyme
MKLWQQELRVKTRGKSFLDLTRQLASAVADAEVERGTCTIFVRHTSASLVIQENADPRVLEDLANWFAELAPESRHWSHDDEGPDDMPAHARSVLTKTSETVPILSGRLALGTWQAVYLWEHRTRAHERQVLVTIIGE